jgi:hypothetical protein
MYRQGSYHGDKAELSPGTVAEITRLLGNLNLADKAPELLNDIAEAVHEYQQMDQLRVNRKELKGERERLQQIAALATQLSEAMRAIDSWIGDEQLTRHSSVARNWLEQYLLLEGAAGQTKAPDRIYRDVGTLARAAGRAAGHRAMNPGVGAEANKGVRRLRSARCAQVPRDYMPNGRTDAESPRDIQGGAAVRAARCRSGPARTDDGECKPVGGSR